MKANINEAVIRFEDYGTGPAILVIHDNASNREIGKIFAPLAQTGYRIVVTHLDGMRAKRSLPFAPQVQTRNALSLLNFLGIGRAVVFGIGSGGSVLLDLLDSAPERIAASSLVLGASSAKQIRELTERPEIGVALKEGRLSDIKEELLGLLPPCGKERTTPPLPRLRSWVEHVRTRSIYFSAIQHRASLLADMDIPPLIVEPEEEEYASRPPARIASLASRGWKKIKGVNAQFAGLIHLLFSPDEEIDEEEILSDLP